MPLLCRFFRPYVRDSLTPPKPIHDQLKPPDKSLEALGALGALGAVKGWGSWLIARPERNVTGAFRDRDNPPSDLRFGIENGELASRYVAEWLSHSGIFQGSASNPWGALLGGS